MEIQQPRERYRIYIDDSHHPTYQELTRAPNEEGSDGEKDTVPFESMKNLFMLAAFVGYRNQKRIPLENKVDIFTWQVLSADEEYVSLIYALAVAETKDIEVLTDRNQILDIAQEYANGGILEIEAYIKDRPGNKIVNLASLLGEFLADGV